MTRQQAKAIVELLTNGDVYQDQTGRISGALVDDNLMQWPPDDCVMIRHGANPLDTVIRTMEGWTHYYNTQLMGSR